MRITVVMGPFLPVPPLRGGAVEKMCFALGRDWADRGHRVTLVSRRFPGLPDAEEQGGLSHRRVASGDAPAGRLAFRLAEALYCRRVLRVLPPAEILLINSVILPLLVRSTRFGVPIHYAGRMPKGQYRLYPRLGLVAAMSRAVAAAVEREAPQFVGRTATVGGPLTEAFAPLAPEALDERPARLLYVGRLHPEKGVHLLIEAFVRLADATGTWRLVLVGPHEVAAGGGGEAYLQRLRALAAPLGERVEFVGPLYDEPALRAQYRRASLFCYPSLAETGEALGMAPVEAMAMGAVPIVSALDCFSDFLEPGLDGFRFDHRAADPVASLAETLRPLLAGARDLAPLRVRALAAAARYSLPAVSGRFLDLFERVAAPQRFS
ncbi:Glycosyltransferase involved in cell wall bisynthesis [Tistlia consotensis]|uniref:Glycosyltransferase involved in cell wall bisynthesis n=1 Tax=Tistlia consotensis USBA 355 TaxID=560819 RepID=A0A1Y6CMD9_9PROT|nr:glycosyltransferase family 4 protein [Tistlia consotensis]SMF63194.1 Glycosyltransferase involved in cell wall bisynthesis [Tistlia consotensis USBA 355]SNR95727.1 Glycosyltransferase involved in cell wall bisynthesis [Tistlia consotensis]